MADLQVSSQLQQWSFEKPTISRPERSHSYESSPDLSHHETETLRIDTAAVQAAQSMVAKERGSFHERYLSSEEDLSPMDGNSSEDYDSDVSIHEVKHCFQARKMSISKWDSGKSLDMAVTVSYVLAGRPKVIDLASLSSPVRETVQRPVSMMQQPPINTTDIRRKQARHTMMPGRSMIRSDSPAISIDSRRPSMSSSPYAYSNKSAQNLSDAISSFGTTSSTRSSSPSVSEGSTSSTRPASAAATLLPQPRRSSLYLVASANRLPTMGPMPPLTPQSPEPHAFLSSDPYESSTVGSASPIIKSQPHKRLRSISQRLSLAKIAITPSTRTWDSRINGKPGNMPLTPASPYTPITPQTALPTTNNTSPLKKLHRNSKFLSRPTTPRVSSSEMPPVKIMPAPPTRSFASERMVARGANEREPMFELPPFPEDDAASHSSIKSRKLRKRKSLMDLL